VLDGPINRKVFELYVEKVLVPELKPGDIVVMDNLSSHKSPAASEMITAAGARLLYLPPYSPDFNPIEKAFSKTQSAFAQSRRTNRRRPLGRNRPPYRPHHFTTICKLLRLSRL
jgi:transposase